VDESEVKHVEREHSPGRASEPKRPRERKTPGAAAAHALNAGCADRWWWPGPATSTSPAAATNRTDDAYVQAARVSVSSNVSGR